MDYNARNSHPRDCRLEFDPADHRYTLDGVTDMESVTTVVEGCFPRFIPEEWAPRVALREGVDPQVVLDRWEREGQQARDAGTLMHDKIERYYLGDDDGDDLDAFRLFRQFAASNRLYPYRTEWRIFHEDYGIAGTLDFLELTPGGVFNIWDWKRSTKLVDDHGNLCCDNRFGSRGLHPLESLHDTSFWHYALQISIYRFILEEKYGIRVADGRLGVFHPAYDKAWVIPLPYLRDHVVALLRHRLSVGSAR